MKIAVLDDYQDAVRKLDCFSLLQDHEVKVFNNTVKGVGQLAARVADVEAIVLIRERTRVTRQLLDRLPKLKIISQTGRVCRRCARTARNRRRCPARRTPRGPCGS